MTIDPPLATADRNELARLVKALASVPPFDQLEHRLFAVEKVRKQLANRNGGSRSAVLPATVMVLADFADQGWSCRYNRGRIQIARPLDESLDRDRIRQQLHIQRDKYLSTPPVREFITAMERRRLWKGKWVSIFSLMRDGSELATALQNHSRQLKLAIDPYIQVVASEAQCEFTGLKLLDIWRYFRSTWANRYQSVPGRSLMFLVRDAAGPHHPVIGIAALGSSAVQINIRDKWIGWDAEDCVAELRLRATDEDVNWLLGLVENGIRDLYTDDLLDQSISPLKVADIQHPTPEIIGALRKLAREEKQKHFRLVNQVDHKSPELEKLESTRRWLEQAELPLFRSKRADLLAMLLRAKAVLINRSGRLTGVRFRDVLASPESRQAIQSLILRAKAERVGVAVADITICGAIAPYSHLLGGKLVAMLAVSPEVVSAYHERYENYESVIASSLAGRPIIRKPHLVFLGTTSLYGTEPTQYTRVSIPCERFGGPTGETVRYKPLGSTCGFGTFQFGDDTVEMLGTAVSQTSRGQRVNSIFGEGTSPRMRKIRDGLDLLKMPSDELLLHGNSRLVYGISLVRNLKRFLLGQDETPDYHIPMDDPRRATSRIAEWWAERWLLPRIARPEVLAQVRSEKLTYPVRHSARVPLPPVGGQSQLPFEPE